MAKIIKITALNLFYLFLKKLFYNNYIWYLIIEIINAILNVNAYTKISFKIKFF